MDYGETFGPVSKMTTVHTLIIVAFIFQWKIFQVDVKNAFLNEDLHDSTTKCHKSGKVCKLQKVLYGPKQEPRAWF